MNPICKLSDLATSNHNKAAAQITSELTEILRVLSKDGKLSRLVPYRIIVKNQNERARLSKLLRYEGPDSHTMELLKHCYIPWLVDPSSFWAGSLLPEVNLLEPQAQIVSRFLHTKRGDAHSIMIQRCSCILLVKLRARHACSSEEETALSLWKSGLFQRSLEELKDVVRSMTDAGYRYQHIEKSLGIGSIIVLGKNIAESTLIKLVPKKGQRFAQVIEHLTSVGIPQLASIYKDLSTEVIDYGLNYYADIMESMQIRDRLVPATQFGDMSNL